MDPEKEELASENEVEVEETAEVETEELETDEVSDEAEETKETPFWMQEDEQGSSNQVPESAIINVKRKLKGQIHERNEEIERLKRENESLKQAQQPAAVEVPKRPRVAEFANDEEYERALDKYEAKKLEAQTNTLVSSQARQQLVEQRAKRVATAVDDHYSRAAKLVETNGIKPEVYQQADLNVKQAIDTVLPNSGENVFNEFVTLMGEGSEKAMFYVGHNKVAREEFQGVLASDPSGLKAAFHLGRVAAKVNGVQTNKTSRAKKPAAQIRGDAPVSAKGSAFRKKYDAAHKSGDAQAAYNLKKDARKAGVDTAKWS